MEPVKPFTRTLSLLRSIVTLAFGTFMGFAIHTGGLPVLYGVFLGAFLLFFLTVED